MKKGNLKYLIRTIAIGVLVCVYNEKKYSKELAWSTVIPITNK